MPLGESMIAVLKNNKRQKAERNELRRGKVSRKVHNGYTFDDKKADEKQIQKIRDDAAQRNKRERTLYTIFALLAIVITFFLFRYLGML